MKTYQKIAKSIPLITVANLCISQAYSQKQKPNILMICIDDLNDYVGCMKGHPNAKTPNIDKLAARGSLFTNAHCQAPICGPSRPQ